MKEIDIELARKAFACIDNTTLRGTDTEATVEAFCRKTIGMTTAACGSVAAVCVYPRFVATAARVLGGSGLKVASVAGAFPHGQVPLQLKVAEAKFAVENGADEVDMVISRGLLLEGDVRTVAAEVRAMKEACGGRTLKVILETCELPSPALVRCATEAALDGGADFVKTSTGKGAAGATLEAAQTMLETLRDYRDRTGRTVGFKAAGGIRLPDEALDYATLALRIMGADYLNPSTFRIGASSLTEQMFDLAR